MNELILVVDDDAAVRHLLQELLRLGGYRVLAAGNGREALKLLHTCADKVELVITDIDMPEMDGLELARRVVAEKPGPSFLLISGVPGTACPVGIPFLPKPFLPSELLEATRNALSYRRAMNA